MKSLNQICWYFGRNNVFIKLFRFLMNFKDFLPAGVKGGHGPVEGHLVGEAIALRAGVVHHGVETPIVRRPRGWRWGSTTKKKD